MPVSLNDVCVFLPAIFAVPATLLTSALTYEASGNTFASALAGVFMAVLPAHLMRSVAGGYDNEALAMTIICATFWLWARALRTPASWPIGLLSGLSYVYMAATWGAYTFVLNMIAVHVIVELVKGNGSAELHRAYTLFYAVGTAGAMQFPMVGWQPLQVRRPTNVVLPR